MGETRPPQLGTEGVYMYFPFPCTSAILSTPLPLLSPSGRDNRHFGRLLIPRFTRRSAPGTSAARYFFHFAEKAPSELSMSSAASCFNNECREAKSESRRKGWRLRNGDHAELCNCCASAFEEGKFCDTFHQHVAGWRSCESCGKPVHCGCIVAEHTFVLLDAGGVNCVDCAIKTSTLTQNQVCSPPSWPTVSFADLRKLSQSLNIGFIHDEKHSLCMRSGIPVMYKDQSHVSHYGVASASFSETENQSRVSITQQQSNLLTANSLSPTSNIGLDSSGKRHRESKILPDINSQNQLYPWYSPEKSNKELQKIPGDSNSTITPLFEKMLSASDASRVGRLVLPKKYAETYFPPISEPEGLPLRIQNSKGQEWTLQFRFWPNNNSRMYVLEGVTPCIQSMELQAGDIVTFSRLEREGKLIMGYRKAASIHTCHQGGKVDPVGLQSKVDKSEYAVKEVIGGKSNVSKRRNGIVGSTIKRMKLDTVRLIELKVTLEEAQGLLRPHIDRAPNVVLVEDFEFEEYEDAPVIGRPTIITKASVGSSCAAAQELNNGQLEDILNTMNSANCKKHKAIKPNPNPGDASNAPSSATMNKSSIRSSMPKEDLSIEQPEHVVSGSNSDGLVGEGILAQATSKHPRHRPGCCCIVCSQPSSGKGPKHTSSCTCNVCGTVRRRFRTMMMRREKKKENEVETVQSVHATGSSRSSDKAAAEQADLLVCSPNPEQMGSSNYKKHKATTKPDPDAPRNASNAPSAATVTKSSSIEFSFDFQSIMMRRLEKEKSETKAETVQPEQATESCRPSVDLVCSNPETGLANDEATTNSNTSSKKPCAGSPGKGHFDLNIQPEREELSPCTNPANVIDKFDDAVRETSKKLN